MPSYRDDARYRKVYAYYRPVPKPFDPSAVSKDYVDDALRAIDYKQSVKLAMATNIDVSVAYVTLDSLSLSDEDRILLKGQADPAENGIYIWYSATQLLSRTLDAADIFLNSGATVYVEEGTYAKTYWTLTTTDPVSVGITEQEWENRIGSPSGSDTEVQFNKLGMLSGSQYFSYNYSQSALEHGLSVTASGLYSHAQGLGTEASGTYSFAGGLYTIASGSGQTVVGKYNKRGNDFSLFVVGAGTDDNNRSDILRVNQGQIQITGSLNVSGDLNVNGTTTAINTTNLEVKDSLIGAGFASGSIAQTSGDRGWIGGINGASNVFSVWDASNSEFAFGSTNDSPSASTVGILAYSPLRISNLQASRVTASLGFSGSHTRLADGTSAFIQGPGILITSASNGAVTITSLIGNSGSFWNNGAIGSNNQLLTADGSGGIVAEPNMTFDGVTMILNGKFIQGYTGNIASGIYAHAEGINTSVTTAAYAGHAEGEYTTAGSSSGVSSDSRASHAEGYYTKTTGRYSHAEGSGSLASGAASHSEGAYTTGSGDFSHAQGLRTQASGTYSFSSGIWTIASGSGQAAFGEYNLRGNDFSLFVVGNGTGDLDANRSDVLRINRGTPTSGRVEVTGSLTTTLGLSGSLTRLHDGTTYLVAGSNITITSGSNGSVTIATTGATAVAGGSDTQIQYNSLNALAGNAALTFNAGTGVTTSQTVLPRVDNTYNLGSATQRWANVYTGDLHLKNDRGDWTLIEEEDCLTVRNNVTGKRYKIAMTPMDE